MVNTRPMKILGRWRDGYAPDMHTVSSAYLGDDEFGSPQFANLRSEVGELLYRLKYRTDTAALAPLVETAAAFIATWNPGADVIVPVPPSRPRSSQPVLLLAEAIAKRLGLSYAPGSVTRTRDVPELKNVYGYDDRIRLLAGAHVVDKEQISGRRVLLFDDLYRSGATMNTIATTLYDDGSAKDVFALTITRTRSNQ